MRLVQYQYINPESLLATVGGDMQTLAALARTFVDSAPEIFSRLERAADTGDLAAVHQVSHTLKSMCALFGADALALLLLQSEKAARQGLLPLQADLSGIEREFERVMREIRTLVQQNDVA